MALADFIQALQEQDVVYSNPPQPSIRVIPPENQSIKIIPPESPVFEQPAPKVIKLKIKQKPVEVDPVKAAITNQTQAQPSQVLQPAKPKLQPVSKPQTMVSSPQPTIQQTQEVIPTYTPPNVPVQKPVEQPVEQHQPKAQQTVQTPIQDYTTQVEAKPPTDDDIFNSTGTEYSKKPLWMEYFIKAKNSRKSNPIVDRMKVGRFTITPDNKVLLLPDYDIVGKDPDDVLKDKWF